MWIFFCQVGAAHTIKYGEVGFTRLNMKKWGIQGSNPYPYIKYILYLPTELRSHKQMWILLFIYF